MAHKVLTTHQVAKECNVHHTTVINWVTEGKLKAYTTPGGHRRISEEDLVKFMKKYEIPIPDKILKKTACNLAPGIAGSRLIQQSKVQIIT